MTTRQLMAYVISCIMVTCYVGMAEAAKPITINDEYSIEMEADDVWTDYAGHEQACGFPFRVDYNDRIILHLFDDHEIYNIQVRDIYTNLDTGFSFEDFASFYIRFDYETGLANHRGNFWRIRVPGEGMQILDVGGFLQDWYGGDYPWPILPESIVGNNHDGNGPFSEGEYPIEAFSYCDMMDGIFPD